MSTTSIIPTPEQRLQILHVYGEKGDRLVREKSDSISLRFRSTARSSKRLGGFLNANHLELSRAGGCLAIYSTGLMNAKNHGFSIFHLMVGNASCYFHY